MALDLNEKIPEPYRTIRNILHILYESAIHGDSGLEISTCRQASEPLPYLTKVLPNHYISMPYGPNLTNIFVIPHVCLYHAYVPTVHSCPNELYNIHGDTHTTIKVTVQSEHEPYQSNGDTSDTNPLRIIQTTLRTSSTVRTKRTVREPEQSEKLPFGYKSRRISHSSPHFLITMKNGIHVDQSNRNDCSRHGASSICSSSLLIHFLRHIFL